MDIDIREALDALPELAWIVGPDGEGEYVNLCWSAYTGVSADRALGLGWQGAIHSDDLPDFHAKWNALAGKSERGEIELRLRRADGEYRWHSVRLAPSGFSSDAKVRWFGIAIDSDERGEGSPLGADTRLQRFVDNLPTQVIFMTPELELEFVNRQVLDYYGKSLDELKQWDGSGAIHPEDLPSVHQGLVDLKILGAAYDQHHRMLRADGEYRWVRSRMVPSRDAQGNIVRYCSVQIEVHDLQRAETLLAGEVELLEMVARGEPLSEILDALCHLVEKITDGCFCSILLISPDQRRFLFGAGPSLPDPYNAVLDGMLIDPYFGPCSLAVVTKTTVITADVGHDARWTGSKWPPLMATYGYDSCWSMPIISNAGKVSAIFAIYRRGSVKPNAQEQELIDRFTKIVGIAISRAQADDALHMSEKKLRRAHAQLAEGQRLSKTGSFTADLQQDWHEWSDEYYRLFEIDFGTPPSVEAVRERVHPDDLDLFDREVRRGFDGGGSDFVFRIVTRAGSIKYLRGVARLMDHIEGRPLFMGTVQDITESVLAEKALGRARAELAHVARITTLSALTASIAHEVSQPLAGILNNANACLRMLSSETANVKGAAETARRTVRDINRATEVIKRLRALFARKEPAVEPVDLNDAAREVIILSAGELSHAQVMVQTDLANNLPLVSGDRIQLQQVILNLLLNAADAMVGVTDRARTIKVQTLVRDGDPVLSVHDVGIGIEADALEKLFDAFYTTKANGMGVGLSISRSIIENLGGRLWAAGNDGPGATFSFSVPPALSDATGSDCDMVLAGTPGSPSPVSRDAS